MSKTDEKTFARVNFSLVAACSHVPSCVSPCSPSFLKVSFVYFSCVSVLSHVIIVVYMYSTFVVLLL